MTLEYGDIVPDSPPAEQVGKLLVRLLDAGAVSGALAAGGDSIRGKLPLADRSNGWDEDFFDNYVDVYARPGGFIGQSFLLGASLLRPSEEKAAATFIMVGSITGNTIDDRDEVNSSHLTREYSPPDVDERYVRWEVIRRQGTAGFFGGWGGGGYDPPEGDFIGTYHMETAEDEVLYSGSVVNGVLADFPEEVEDDVDWSLTVQYFPSEPDPPLVHDGSSVVVSYEIRVYLRE